MVGDSQLLYYENSGLIQYIHRPPTIYVGFIVRKKLRTCNTGVVMPQPKTTVPGQYNYTLY